MAFSHLERLLQQNVQERTYLEFPQFFDDILWLNIHVCFPFTLLVLGLSCVVQKNGPDHYYMNLLLCNILQLTFVIVQVTFGDGTELNHFCYLAYCCGVAAGLIFRTVVAWKRYSSFSSPQLDSSGNTQCFCVGCIMVWLFFVLSFGVMTAFDMTFYLFFFPLLFLPLCIISLVWIIRSLSTAISVAAEEKCRTVGTLVLWLVNYSVTILTPAMYVTYARWFGCDGESLFIFLTLSLLSPFLDLVLFVFMWKNFTEKLLMCFCCCRIGNTAEKKTNRSSV